MIKYTSQDYLAEKVIHDEDTILVQKSGGSVVRGSNDNVYSVTLFFK